MSMETISWHRPDEGDFPDADIDVLLHTDCQDCPVWPGYYDGEQWLGADGMPLRWRVIEWCEMPGGSGSLKRWRHPDGGTYTEIGRGLQRPLMTDPWTEAVMYVADKDGAMYARGTDYFEWRFEPINEITHQEGGAA